MPASHPSPIPQRTKLFAAAIVIVAGCLAYLGSLSAPFLFDDAEAITDNLSIRHLATALSPPPDITASGRPILNLSLALNYALGRNSVPGYHALNLLIHVLSGLVLLGIVGRTLDQPVLAKRFGAASLSLSLAVALIWTVHPLQTESVTYVIQRAESLMGLFYLLTLYCFIRFASGRAAAGRTPATEAGKGVWAVLAVTACLLGTATKEVMVSAPLIVLLYDRTFVAGSFREALRRRPWCHAGLAASWLLLCWLVAGTGGNRGGTIGFGIGVPWWKYALTQFRSISVYFGLSVWPHPLNFDRAPFWVTGARDVVPYAVPVLAALVATGLALRRWPAAGFLGCWLFAILAPTSSIVPGTTQMVVEHRMYLSLAAIVVFAVTGLHELLGRRSLVVFAALALPLGFATAARNADYCSELSLWGDTAAKDPKNVFAQVNYGVALAQAGDTAGAITHYRIALRVQPNSVEAHTDLGNALLKIGQTDEAWREYAEALRLRPAFPQAHIDVGNALVESGRLAEGIVQYTEAIRLAPGSVEAQSNLGLALMKSAKIPEAIEHFETALRLNPDFAPAEFNLGNALRMTGRTAEAIGHYEQALRLKPDLAAASLNLGNLLLQQGRPDDAIARYEEALRLAPGYAELHNSLGLVLARSGRLPEAVAQFQEALRLKPDYPAAQTNLGHALRPEERAEASPNPPSR